MTIVTDKILKNIMFKRFLDNGKAGKWCIVFLMVKSFFFVMGSPFPISFSIPESKIISHIHQKDRDFAFIVPGNLSTYIYQNEEDYYSDYQRSYYAITFKKGGWDCLRHYEILANGCIPYFIDIDNCPPKTMHLYPKELIREAMHLPGVSNGRIDHAKFDKKRYFKILDELLEYTRKHLTCRAIAQYMLDTIGYSGKGKILYLAFNNDCDYLKCLTLIGLKQVNPENVIDFPKVDLIYKNYPYDAKLLYGKGFTYTKIVDDIQVGRDNIEQRIKNKEFEYIIYPYVHHGCLFEDLVKQHYSSGKIAYICGEDDHYCCFANLHNLFLREYDQKYE
jgi:hypothetical protein